MILSTVRKKVCANKAPPHRIVRDYEKYISRQLKRGTSRQELNVSWLKKNELDLKRHVQELRDNIRSNWSTTGQELGRELRGFWPASRPQSPAPTASHINPLATAGAAMSTRSYNGADPTSPSGASSIHGGPRSPGAEVRAATGVAGNDFMTGYTIGLVGGVRSWVRGPWCFVYIYFREMCRLTDNRWPRAGAISVTAGLPATTIRTRSVGAPHSSLEAEVNTLRRTRLSKLLSRPDNQVNLAITSN